MANKKKKKAAAPSKAEKRTAAQKKVAKALKRPAAEPKPEPKREVKLGGEQTTPSASPGFELPTEVPPQIREAYRSRFEEQQLAEIGRESSIAEKTLREKSISEMGTPTEPEAVKAVRGETAIPESERPLTPKPEPLPEPTPGQQAKRQAGRLPRGIGRTGVFTFESATREEPTPGVKTQLDIARQSQKGRDISPLAPHVQATALTLARRDHDLAKSSGKEVNGISPESQTPDLVSIRGSHHERLAEVIHGYGVKEEDLNKIPGKPDLPTKVKFAWSALKEHERSKRKVAMPPSSQGATHWQDPKTGKLRALSEGGHPEFYTHEGETNALVRGKGEASWRALPPTREGWKVTKLRGGVNAWTFVSHPAEKLRDTHQVRSLYEHVSNTLKGSFPELAGPTSPSADSRRRTAENVREKFVVTRPEPAEAGAFSKRVVQTAGPLGNITDKDKYVMRRQRGRTRRTLVAGPTSDNITIENTPETEIVARPARIEPRRPKIVQEEGGRRVIRPKRRDESKKVGYVSQPLTVGTQLSETTRELERQKKLRSLTPEASGLGGTSTIGPSGEILRSAPRVIKEIIPDEKALKKNPKSTKTRVKYNVTPGMVDQPFPGMEKMQKVTPAKPEGEFAGETGLEQLKYLKGKAGLASQRAVAKVEPAKRTRGMEILKGTDTAAERNIPQQLELPGIESPGYAGAMGQQFRRVSPATRELQLKSQQGAVPGAAAAMPRGMEPKKSTRSFKGRK